MTVVKQEKYDLIVQFNGYMTKPDPTKEDGSFLVLGSKNVRVNDRERIESQKGYTLDGQAGTTNTPIVSSDTWNTSRGFSRPMRTFEGATAGTGKLQYRYTPTGSSTAQYYDLMTNLTNVTMEFAYWWDLATLNDWLVWVDGTSTIRYWTGCVTEVVSNTATTITTNTASLTGAKFSTTGNLIINGTSYAYTGISGNQFTGLTALPAFTANTPVAQSVIAVANKPNATFNSNTISVDNNHIWVASRTSQDIYMSKSDVFLDFSFTTPVRKPSDGIKYTVDDYGVAFKKDNNGLMNISAGKDYLYSVERQYTADGTGESIKFVAKRVPQQGAMSQGSFDKTKNNIVLVTNEPSFDSLANVINTANEQARAISDPIKTEFAEYDFAIAPHIKYFKNSMYVAIPSESIIMEYDLQNNYWQPPYTVPVSRLEVIDGELYGHSAINNETYKLYDGLNFNGVAIDQVARFAYRQYGNRAFFKEFDNYYTELYISSITEVVMRQYFEYQGSLDERAYDILGTDTDLQFAPTSDNSLGKVPLGAYPLGGTTAEPDVLVKMRIIHETTTNPFFEHQTEYSCDTKDGQFRLLAHGGNTRLSTMNTAFYRR